MSSNRKIKQNIYGNWNGYVGRNKVIEFGADGMAAAYWKLTGLVDFYGAFSKDWYELCKNELER